MTIESSRRAALAAGLALATAACDGSPAGPRREPVGTCVPALEGVSQVMDSVVDARDAEGGLLLVMRADQVLCEQAFGGYALDEAVPIASASKWLTAVAMLTLVDDGHLSLDAPIGEWLDYFQGEPLTLRQLLSHTSGLGDGSCLGVITTTLPECARQIAQSTRRALPGTRFIYGGGSFTVAGALAGTVTLQAWPALWRARVQEPLGLTNTSWDNLRNPLLAGGATSTMQDYAKVMRMILSGGQAGGQAVLSAAAIQEMRRDNAGSLPVLFSPRGDAAGYSLGSWIDAADAQGRATQLSSVGASGFYPWLDFERNLVVIVMLPASAGDGYWYSISRRVQAEVRRVVDAGI